MGSGRSPSTALSGFATLALLLGDVCTAETVTFDWRVTSIFSSFDVVALTSLGINDAPASQAAINVTLGDEVQMTVTNKLDQDTCLHWHGLKQLGTQEMDGTSGITQCHIKPDTTVTYTLTPDKAGTFWWHSHFSHQYAFGLRGPLNVHAPADQLQSWEKDIDGEYTIQLADTYHAAPGPVAPMWDTILINDLGRYNCTAAASRGYSSCNDN
ncbi:Multicopper oxidase [Phytophthora infestans]|uniref:Multicopper oxidase n=1 Tax=Phytophthora infestans TaxID=4787 RepID=A0A833WFZ5_PHYIN|nr:Multicopper oxidase [Phytophthora infestans]KAF4146178.1 Multicopper oxidase [Phytophthora infestans]